MQTEQIKITGMSCGGCSSKVTNALSAVKGVEKVIVSLADANATIQYDQTLTTPDLLKAVISRTGFHVVPDNASTQVENKGGCD